MRGMLLRIGMAVALAVPVAAQQPVRVPPAVIVRVAAEVMALMDTCEAQSMAGCAEQRDEFALNYQEARLGSLQKQREVALALMFGQAPIRKNTMEACAWQGLVVGTTRPNVSQMDQAMFGATCLQLVPAQMDAAQLRLNALRTLIAADIQATMRVNPRR